MRVYVQDTIQTDCIAGRLAGIPTLDQPGRKKRGEAGAYRQSSDTAHSAQMPVTIQPGQLPHFKL